jgi:hypothetical protein
MLEMSPSSTSGSGLVREKRSIEFRASSRKASSLYSERATPTNSKRSGKVPSWARLYSAGSSLRCARSPVAPKIVIVVGCTGIRSSPGTSGLVPGATA